MTLNETNRLNELKEDLTEEGWETEDHDREVMLEKFELDLFDRDI